MELHEKIIPSKTAVICIDVQNDFCHKDGAFSKVLGWDAEPIRQMVPRLIKFIDIARSEGCPIFFSQMINDDLLSPANLRERLTNGAEHNAGEFPFALQPQSWGWQLYEVKPQKNDKVFEKWYYDFLSAPELREELRRLNIKTLIITGLYTQVCVLATAQRGFTEKFNIIIPEDLVATTVEKQDLAKSAMEILTGYFAEVTTAENLTALWKI